MLWRCPPLICSTRALACPRGPAVVWARRYSAQPASAVSGTEIREPATRLEDTEDLDRVLASPQFYHRLKNEIRERWGLPHLVNRQDIKSHTSNDRQVDLEWVIRRTQGILSLLEKLPLDRSAPKIVETALFAKWPVKRRTELPRIPKFWTRDSLRSFIGTITANNGAYDSKHHDVDGVLRTTVHDLLRYNNKSTYPHHSVETFNKAIAYFARLHDLQATKEIFYTIRSVGLKPNTDSYNLRILAQSTRNRPHHSHRLHPLRLIKVMLAEMISSDVPANYQTWNIIMLCIPFPVARILFAREMIKYSIPLSRRGGGQFVEDVVKLRSSRIAAEFLETQPYFEVTTECVNEIVKDHVRKHNWDIAWEYIHHAVEKFHITPTTSTLNMLLEGAAHEGRVDWGIALMQYMTKKWNVCPNVASYRNLIEAEVRRPYHQHKGRILRMLYGALATKFPQKYVGDRLLKHWVARAQRQFEFYQSEGLTTESLQDLPTELTSELSAEWKTIQEALQWPDERPRFFPQNGVQVSETYNHAASYLLGYDASTITAKDQRSGVFKADPHKAKLKQFNKAKVMTEDEKRRDHEMARRRNLLKKGPFENYREQFKRLMSS